MAGKLYPKKRDAILSAAGEAFRADGFAATTMDRIAERAGVSKRTVYNHFPSKDALFDVITEQLWTALVPPPSERGEPHRDAPVETRLERFAERRLDILLKPELVGLLRVVLGESVRAPELARAFTAPDLLARSELGLRALLLDEMTRGRLRIDHVELAGGQFWGLILNTLFWPLVIGLRGTPDADERAIVVGEAIATFLSRYRGDPRGRSAEPASRARSARPSRGRARTKLGRRS